ncbi:MAG: TldD/PmbA family protein, partial [Thermoplasmata archaeon]
MLKEIDENLPKDIGISTRYFSAGMEEKTKYYVNSDGARIECSIPRMKYFGAIRVKYGGESEQSSVQLGRCEGYEFFRNSNILERMKKEAKSLHNILKEGVKPPSGYVDLVLGPEVVGIAVHESCGHPYEADRILGREAAQAGESFVTPSMLGQKIGSEVVTVIDDPTMENNNGFYLYDDEGVKARPRELIKNGIINELLHNRATAETLGTKSNASARALDYEYEPIVRMSNTYMKPGEYEFEELFEGIKSGIYMKSFNEWNIDDIRYNQKYVGREAYIIENGKIGKPVRRPVLELTTPKFYQSIDAVGKNGEWFAATCGKGEPM